MTKWLNSLQPVGALLMRLVLGVSMTVYGYEKVHPMSALHHYAHYVTTLGMPYWLGYVSAYTEFIGGILLVVGLFTRLIAFLVGVNMLVAFATVDIHHDFDFYGYILALAVLAIMLFFYGAGAMALDRKIGFA